MSQDTSFFSVGYVVKSHGIHGKLVVSLTSSHGNIVENQRKIWLGDDPFHISPWEIESLDHKGNTIYLKLRDVNSRKEADYLKSIRIFLPDSSIQEDVVTKIIGFTVINFVTGKQIGKVSDFDDNNPQPVLEIQTEKGKFLIPGVDEFIKDINWQTETVSVKIIEGLNPK